MGRRHGARLAALALGALLVAGCARPFAVDGERALARVRHQVDAGPRIPGTPGHAAIRDWLAAEVERLGGRVTRQSFVDTTLGRPLALTNVLGRWGPETGPRLVLLAHWDTRPFSDRDPDPARRNDPVPGANDAGSGVAVLLEVAELLKATPPAVPVELVFLDGEDQGEASAEAEFCLGSRHYAAQAERGSIRGAFVFDMVGDRDLRIHPEVYSARRAANLVAVVLEAARATGAHHFHAEPRHAVFDDHIPLLDAGFPAVDVIDFDYPAWHTHGDDLSQVSAESLAEVSRVAAWIVYRSPLARP
jgi:glutaminyl-peptide cyclotransferase